MGACQNTTQWEVLSLIVVSVIVDRRNRWELIVQEKFYNAVEFEWSYNTGKNSVDTAGYTMAIEE